MKKLNFLIGKWSGEARALRGPGEPVELVQTEEASYKLDGLILTIEGVGRTKLDGKIALQAFAIVSYDDETEAYRMRAYKDGRYLESKIKMNENGQWISWGFTLGVIKTSSVLPINEEGQWKELAEIEIGSQPARTFMELKVSRLK